MATTSGPALMLDTWAFAEERFGGPHKEERMARRKRTRRVVTVRDVLVESDSLARRRAAPPVVREWWDIVRETRELVVLEPTLDQISALAASAPRTSGLSMVDFAVAWAAKHERTKEVATGDRGFRALGLEPLFAGP